MIIRNLQRIPYGWVRHDHLWRSSPAIRAAMPWLFIGAETICYAAIFVLFLFMNVEKYSDEDHAILASRSANGAGSEHAYPVGSDRIGIFIFACFGVPLGKLLVTGGIVQYNGVIIEA